MHPDELTRLILAAAEDRMATDIRVLAVDEITTPEDLAAVRQAAFTGTAILATAHAFAPEDLSRRPLYRELAAAGVFERRIFIDACRRPVFFGGEGEE